MKKTGLCLAILFFCSVAIAQTGSFYVSGKVIDAVTRAPLPGASVFAQNTTQGTATNTEGNFKLALFNGGYDLIITFSGYQTETKRISTADAAGNILVELKVKEKSMENVIITSSSEVKDGWEKYGNFFLQNFIGETANSKYCTIKNKDVLKFYFSKRRNRLKILASEPLEIVNEALGYNIRYSIDSFTYEYNTQTTLYTGYPLFEEMLTMDTARQHTWAANRIKAYKGSMLHFMRSLFNKKLKEEGFEIQFLVTTNNKESAVPLLNFYSAMNYSKEDSTNTVEVKPNQSTVLLLYNKDQPEAAYLVANPDAPAKFQLSILNFTPNESIIIEENGYYFEQTDIIKNEYLAWKKMADMLPFDFKID